ncbi:glycerol-3-phosphate dehydrogenase/oxidase [Nakamurella leprariae]|uniref:Glycerol-3-phosphate dehydrogenase n=1 Tax=Nakamurella leprariae TaxID=2803911 RepID=A0A938YH25_9ACTN|nr:glycerol-3-phosphate dehydrogenase/oxidase [Nakamurella leprariae]MBM9467675.1 glycerol-3-phosphate dehydrogenase/oxidase [Nakamurella leprariae]
MPVPPWSPQLGPERRRRDLDRLRTQHFDVVVVGGGVVGAGAALDAVTRGLSVALVEARDLAAGTSSRSSKLFHGGLRYLEMFEFGLVREALRERELMLSRLCPHLARPVSFLYPLTRPLIERPYVGAGLALYDTMGGSRSVPRHRHLRRSGARRLVPALKRDTLVGGIRYYDGLVDDARHTLAVARTAAAHGAVVLTSTEVVDVLRHAEDDAGNEDGAGDGASGDRVTGVRVRDLEAPDEPAFDVHGTVVISATGVWSDELQAMAGATPSFTVRASKGVHLLVPRARIDADSGMILRTATSVLFVIPWKDHWIVGTTDTDWHLDLAEPAATATDIRYLLDQVNRVLTVPLTTDDIEGVYAGLRPLLARAHTGGRHPSRVSREHAVARPVPGLVVVAGGKYTTYRVMGADAVDAAAVDLPEPIPPSCTERIPLVGADGFPALRNQAAQLAADWDLPVGTVRHLLHRYGSELHQVLTPAVDDRSLLMPLPGAEHYLCAEVRFAAVAEGALHVDDVLLRRTRIAMETGHRGADSAVAVAGLMGDVLGWDTERRAAEVAAVLDRVAAERASQQQLTDAAADGIRRTAPDAERSAGTLAGDRV